MTKILYFLSKYNRLVLYTAVSIIAFLWVGIINQIGIEKTDILIYLSIAMGLINILLALTYNKIPHLIGFTIFIISVNVYAISTTLVTDLVCGTEFYVYGSIPALFLFTTDLKKPKFYFLIMNCILFATLTVLIYKKIMQPLEGLWLHKQNLFFITNNYYTTIVTSSVLFFACIFCDLILKRSYRREQFIKETVDYNAKHDPLTGLMNRRRIAGVFSQIEENKNKNKIDYAIGIFDIDDFKRINDVYGHSAGDFVLKTYSKRIWDEFPEPVRVGRWGGEEFVIIFPAFDDDIIFRLEDARARICQDPIIYEGRAIKVTATYGISSSRHKNSLNEVLSDADSYLYIGKQNGKNRLVVSEDY